MKFRILDKNGHTTVVIRERKVAVKKFNDLKKEGYLAYDENGPVEKCPDTVEELIFGKEFDGKDSPRGV